MFSIINKLKGEGVLRLFHDYRQGHCQDLSGTGNHGTPTAGCIWNGNEGLFISGTNKVTVANHASIQLTTGTWVIHTAEIKQQITNNALYYKDNAVNYELAIYTTATQLGIYASGGSLINAVLNHNRMVSMGIVSPGFPSFYLNGIFVGLGGSSRTITLYAYDAIIGSNSSSSGSINNCVKSVLIISRVLTQSEHALLFAELEAIKFSRSI